MNRSVKTISELRKRKRLLALPVMLLLVASLSACGYPSPSNGGNLTPFVVVVTPTPLSATATAYADATVLARNTPTALPLTFVAPPAATVSNAKTAAVQPSPSPTLALQGDEYTIQSGDTLLGIAIRFNVDFQEMVTLNNITDPNSIKIGQKVKLPKRKVGTPGSSLTVTPRG
jgi:LysM repeat protein